MRISDWSSDVCSSDLGGRAGGGVRCGAGGRGGRRAEGVGDGVAAPGRAPGGGGGAAAARRGEGGRPGDRTSVVEGKSVSVRVDLGGRRCLKKPRQHAARRDSARSTRTERPKKCHCTVEH